MYGSGERVSAERRATGQRGEALAAAFLERRGYGIIARNWRCTAGEIDLIATHDATLVFVEVRTRRARTPGLAAESVTRRKQQRLATLAAAYLQTLDDTGTPWPGPWRIDVVAVQLGLDDRARVQHLEAAVQDME